MKTIKGIWRFSRVICYTFVCLFQAYTRFKRVDRKEKGRMLRYYPTQVLKLAGVRCSYEGNVPELLHECGLTDTPPGLHGLKQSYFLARYLFFGLSAAESLYCES